jgi:type II secretory pathway pseudopilin PulG
MNLSNKKGAFSFVEIIITLSIIVLLAVIWLNANNNYQDRASNAKIVSDIETLNNALTEYANENDSLPMPWGNNNFFKADASYGHSYEESETFWVHGFITEDTISKKYLQIVPLDPNTKQYYAYGKTKEENNSIVQYKKVANQFEIAWVFKENNVNSAFVRWNYTAQIGPFNLIREYNGPNFVFDEGIYLPYNPDERILTARVWDYSGTVTINGKSENISNIELISGDEIIVSAGGTASIYFSDGTKSVLWDTTEESKLVLSQMDFLEKNNLITKVKLVLWGWTIWNKASHLDDNSGFEIYTTDSTAAVRWTIFWVNKGSTSTNVTVQKWKVEVAKVTSATDLDTLKNQVEKESVQKTLIPNTNGTDADSIIESDGASKWITIDGGTGNASSGTKAKDTIEEEVENEMIHEIGDVSSSSRPEIHSWTRSWDNFEAEIALDDSYTNADYLKIEYDEENETASFLKLIPQVNAGNTIEAYKENDWKTVWKLILNQDTVFTKKDGSTIKLGQINKKVTIFFGTRLGDGSVIESRGQGLSLALTSSYERNEDGEIAQIFPEDWNEDGTIIVPNPSDPGTTDPNPPSNDDENLASCIINYTGYKPENYTLDHLDTKLFKKIIDIEWGESIYIREVTCNSGTPTYTQLPTETSCSDERYELNWDSCKLKAPESETIDYGPIIAGTQKEWLGLDGEFIIKLEVANVPSDKRYLLHRPGVIQLYFGKDDDAWKICFQKSSSDYKICTSGTTDVHFERNSNNQIYINGDPTGKYVNGNVDYLYIWAGILWSNKLFKIDVQSLKISK